MADNCCTYMPELDDVHRWLPSNVLRDIGIADPAERRRRAVVEELATRLAGVLGGGAPGEIAATHSQRPPSCQRPQVSRGGGGTTIRGHHGLAGAGSSRAAAAPPPHLPAPAAPWQVMACGPTNTMVMRPAAALHQPRQLAQVASHPHPPLRGAVAQRASRRSSGTGFFLPGTTVGAAVPPRHANNAARQRQCRAQRQGRRGYEASVAMARRQQQELVAQAMAANVVQMRQLAGGPVTTFPELPLPPEWAY